MGRLNKLFDRLNNSQFCRYEKHGISHINIKERKETQLLSYELLEVGRTDPSREQVMIGCFDEGLTRVSYLGEDASKMYQTLEALKIPLHPSNIGEIVFKDFKQHLEEYQNQTEPISLEQEIIPGKEHQFRTILEKLVHVYAGNKIDKEFYTAK